MTLWPTTDGLGDVFDSGDAHAGQPIEDRYGLVKYPAEGMAVSSPWLPTLAVTGLDLLALVDPEEHDRVQRTADKRAVLRRKHKRIPNDHPDWLIHGVATRAEEDIYLARAGLTLAEAKELVAPRRQ